MAKKAKEETVEEVVETVEKEEPKEEAEKETTESTTDVVPVPSYFSGLMQADAQLISEVEEEEESLISDDEQAGWDNFYLKFPQRTSTADVDEIEEAGLTSRKAIVVTNSRRHNFGTEDAQTDVVEELDFILIADLVEGSGRDRHGARVLNRKVYDPENTDALCASSNGLAPFPAYVGNEITDYPEFGTIRIGFDENGNPLSDGLICQNCPLSNWGYVRKLAGVSKPPCSPRWEYHIWTPKYGFVTVSSRNDGVQVALRGVSAGRWGSTKEGGPIHGMTYFFVPNGEIEEVRTLENLSVVERRRIIGYTTETEVTDETEFVPLQMRVGNFDNQEASKRLEEISPKYVKLKSPKYRYAPKGLPNIDHPDRPVYKVRMTKTENNSSPAGFVPYLTLTDETWTRDEFTAFLQARVEYLGNKVYEARFQRETVEQAREKLSELHITIEAPERKALPTSVSSEDQEEVIEGEIVIEDDEMV